MALPYAGLALVLKQLPNAATAPAPMPWSHAAGTRWGLLGLMALHATPCARWHATSPRRATTSEALARGGVHGLVHLARVSNRRAQDVNRNGAGFALQQMQVDLATDWGVALPWKRNLVEDWKDAPTLGAVDRGGQMMAPAPGIHGDVAACDYSGYYPSLVVGHNLSSDTLNCMCCPDGPVIPELGYHVCGKGWDTKRRSCGACGRTAAGQRPSCAGTRPLERWMRPWWPGAGGEVRFLLRGRRGGGPWRGSQ